MGHPCCGRSASEAAAMLQLQPHPNGGFFKETFRDPSIVLFKSQLPPHCPSACCHVALDVSPLTWHQSRHLRTKKVAKSPDKVDRTISTAVYFLLPSGSVSQIHRIPCAETFHFYLGEPITVFELHDGGVMKLTVLGPDLGTGQLFQYTMPPHTWFGLFPTGDIESYSPNGSSLKLASKRDPEHHYSLVGGTCAPAFQFQDSEAATFAELVALAPEAESFIRYLTPSK